MEKKVTNKGKILNVVGTVLFSMFAVIALFSVSATIISKKNGDNGFSLFNHQAMLVLSDSMGQCDETDVSRYEIKSVPVNSMIFIENVPEKEEESFKWYSDIKVGDVLTFKYRYDRQVTITHRVIDKTPIETGEDKGFVFRLMGDNKASGSNPGVQIIDTTEKNSFNYVIGKVTGQSVMLGGTVTFLRSPIGIAVFVIAPFFGLFVYEVIKIIRIISEGKREKLVAQNGELSVKSNEQEKEIQRLREELAQLKKGQDEESTESIDKEENK